MNLFKPAVTNSDVFKRMERKREFTDLSGYKGCRLVLGFYYYLNEDKVGDRNNDWWMMAHD